jgi:fibronectin-binding autotransporter adhesin
MICWLGENAMADTSLNIGRKSGVKSLVLAAVLGASCILGFTASAAPITWNGASAVPTANWSDGGNWVGGNAPQPGDSLTFDGTVQTTNTDDFAAATNFAGITIASTAGAFTLNGTNSINLSGDIVQNRSSTTVSTINIPLALQTNVNINTSVASANLVIGGAISGTGFSVTKTGAGVATLSSTASSYTGGTGISAGTLRLSASGNTTAIMGTGAVTLSNGAQLDLRSTSATTFNNDLVMSTGGGSIAVRTNDTFSPASITGSGVLSFLSDSGNLLFTSGDFKNWNGQLNILQNGANNMSLRLASTFANSSMINLAIDLAAGSAISKQNGTNATTVIDIGKLSSSASTSSLGASASAGSGVWLYSIGARNEDSTFAGTVVDGSTKTGIRKVGNGILTLSGTGSSFTGASSVNAGILRVDGTLTGTGLALTVNTGGTLGGTGSIAGTVSSVGGTIAPGDSPGTLTVSNVVTIDSSSTLSYELNGGNTAVGGGINDLLTGVTNLTLDGTLNVAETVAGSFATAPVGSTWRLINYSGTLTDNILNIGTVPTLPAGDVLKVDTSTAGQVNLVLTTAPEPAGLSVLALAGVAGLRRRRNA